MSKGLRQRVLFFVPILLGAFVLMSACQKKVSEEDRVRQLIRQVAEGASKRDLAAMIKPTTKDFVGIIKGNDEPMQRKMVQMMLFRYLRKDPAPQVILRSIDVDLHKDKANAKVMALVGRGPKNLMKIGQGQSQAAAMQFDLQLKKIDDKWKLKTAVYQRIDPKKLLLAE